MEALYLLYTTGNVGLPRSIHNLKKGKNVVSSSNDTLVWTEVRYRKSKKAGIAGSSAYAGVEGEGKAGDIAIAFDGDEGEAVGVSPLDLGCTGSPETVLPAGDSPLDLCEVVEPALVVNDPCSPSLADKSLQSLLAFEGIECPDDILHPALESGEADLHPASESGEADLHPASESGEADLLAPENLIEETELVPFPKNLAAVAKLSHENGNVAVCPERELDL